MSRVPSELASGTPVLVWSVTKTSAIVVTLDGGRYRLDARPYSDGPHFECAGQDGNGKLPPLKALSNGPFPPAVQHQVLSGKQIQALEGAGQLPAGTSKALEDARTAGHACSDRLWQSRFAARDKANTVADILETTRRNRGAAIQSEWQDLIAKQCAPQKSAFDAALQSAIQTRAQARLALFNDVSPAVTQRAAR